MTEELTGTTFLDRRAGEAWRELRSQLGDRLVALRAGEHVVIEVDLGVDDEDAVGASPYVQLAGFGDEPWIRAEAVSDHYLDERRLLGEGGDALLRALGWSPPTHGPGDEPDSGSANWFLDRERSRADEVAELAVRALRDVYGCAHPAFLRVEGDFVPTGIAAPAAPPFEGGGTSGSDESTIERIAREDRIEHPRSHDELVALVTETLASLYDGTVEPDGDGDFPIRFGRSVLYVRVWESEPSVELYAELVDGVQDTAAARREANVFNRDVVLGTCWVRDGVVRFRHVLCAMPFSSEHLRQVLARIGSDLDERAEDMAERVGGQRFLDGVEGVPAPGGEESDEGDLDEQPDPDRIPVLDAPAHPMVPVLGELLAIDEPSDRVVAGLFDGDVEVLAETIAALREEPPADLDPADAIAALQRGLAYAARRLADRSVGTRRVQPRRRPDSQQSALIAPRDVEESSLDLGLDG